MRKYDFDRQRDMKGTSNWKWDNEGATCKYPLGVADTDYIPPVEVMDAIAQKAKQGNFAYGVLPEAFGGSIAEWYKKRHGSELNSKWVRTAPGLIVAIKMFMDAVTRPGEQVIIQPPVYFNFSLVIERNGRKIVNNTLLYENEKYAIDFDDLEIKASDPRTTMMIFCNPHNPIGRAWAKEDVERVAEICNRNNVFVVSDEAHSDLVFSGVLHTPFVSVNNETALNSASINSPGKAFNMNGLYVSYVIVPNEKIREKYDIAYSNHHFDFTTLGAEGMIAAYKHGDQYIEEVVEYIQGNVEYLRNFLESQMPEVKMVEANATYLMWLDFSEWRMGSDEIDSFFRSAGVALNKGNIYGEAGDGFMRMNIACTREVLAEALNAVSDRYGQAFSK